MLIGSDGWTKLASIAQLAAAAGTLALACVTAWMAKRTHEVAKGTTSLTKETRAVATKTGDLAAATAQQVQLDFEALTTTVRPVIVDIPEKQFFEVEQQPTLRHSVFEAAAAVQRDIGTRQLLEELRIALGTEGD